MESLLLHNCSSFARPNLSKPRCWEWGGGRWGIKGNLDMNHLGTTCVGGTSGETLNGACLMSLRANMGSKMHASQSCQPAPQPWCQLQESGDLKQGLTLPEVLCFFLFPPPQEIRAHIPILLDSRGCPENQMTSIIDSFLHSFI